MAESQNEMPQNKNSGGYKKVVKDLIVAFVSVSIILFFGIRVLDQAGITKDEATDFLKTNLHWILLGFGGVILLNSFSQKKKIIPALFGLALTITGSTLWYTKSHPIAGLSWHRETQLMEWIGPGSINYTNSFGEIKEVSISKGFWMDKTEVVGQARYQRNYWRDSRRRAPRRLPMTYISWQSAQDTCDFATTNAISGKFLPRGYAYRLPTTNEWIYASLYNRQKSESTPGRPVYQDGRRTRASIVDEESSKLQFLQNMEGNVWEWCYDAVPAPMETLEQPPISSAFRAAIGGGWTSPETLCRPDSIISLNEYDSFKFVGFRMVLSKIPSDSK